ncbi:reverse transcriptase domain-containing protein [Tanacetum coccineum]
MDNNLGDNLLATTYNEAECYWDKLYCWAYPTATGNQRNLTCFECGNQRHYRSECPRLKNQNCGNQTGNGKARGRVYALRGGETDQDPNNIVDDIDA